MWMRLGALNGKHAGLLYVLLDRKRFSMITKKYQKKIYFVFHHSKMCLLHLIIFVLHVFHLSINSCC